MATSKAYMTYILDQFSGVEGITCRPMMGEYLLYCQGRLMGGLYDDRLLVKPVPAALALMPAAHQEPPYKGAKPMLLVENVDDRAFLARLTAAMLPELPLPRKKK